MRVTHVITRLIVGGAQENTLATVLGLREKPGVTVRLLAGLTTGPEGTLESQVSGIPGLLTILPDLVRPISPWRDVRAWRALTRHFRAERPDLVHTHSGKAGVLGRLAARRARVPVIVHTIHGPSFGPFQGALANSVFRTAEQVAGRATTHFISVANAMTEQYLAAGIGRPEQYTRIFSGFDLVPFLKSQNDPALRARLGLDPGDFVIGKIARLFEHKGHDDLFRIAPALLAANPLVKFLLVGDGIWRNRFERRIKSLGLESRFRFTGLVRPAQIPSLVGVMDALVHLSRREGLPRALPQAMAAGRPVVACDCDGAREVCLDGETGFLVPPGDPALLTHRLEQLVRDPALCSQLGARGREFVRERFPVTRMVDEICALYQRHLPRPAAA